MDCLSGTGTEADSVEAMELGASLTGLMGDVC